MAPARCPVCNDIIQLGVTLKLNQVIICPTCLTSLQVVSLNPAELDLPDRPVISSNRNPTRVGAKKSPKDNRRNSNRLGLDFSELDEYEDEFDDYTIEKRLRHKSERDRRRRDTPRK